MNASPTPSSASLCELLRHYVAASPEDNWCSATIVCKYRSSYRRAGAMMLVDPLGQTRGLISGGCLEADIQLRARKVKALGRPDCVIYDSSEVDNIAAELGIGCNGRVSVLIQELTPAHRQLLCELFERLLRGQHSHLLQCFHSRDPNDLNSLALLDDQLRMLGATPNCALPDLQLGRTSQHQLLGDAKRQWSLTRHLPPVNLWILGGGIDAQPIACMAAMLGWQVTVADQRLTHARDLNFPFAARFIQQPAAQFNQPIGAHAAIVMTHNLASDAAWLQQLQRAENLRYIGLLGPRERKQTVLSLAGLSGSEPVCQLLHGPMGFDIGGDLPESIALSVLSQCHQQLAREGII